MEVWPSLVLYLPCNPRSPGLLPSRRCTSAVGSHRVLAARTPRRPLRNRRCQTFAILQESRFGLARLIEEGDRSTRYGSVSPTSSLPRGTLQINGLAGFLGLFIPVVGMDGRDRAKHNNTSSIRLCKSQVNIMEKQKRMFEVKASNARTPVLGAAYLAQLPTFFQSGESRKLRCVTSLR